MAKTIFHGLPSGLGCSEFPLDTRSFLSCHITWPHRAGQALSALGHKHALHHHRAQRRSLLKFCHQHTQQSST